MRRTACRTAILVLVAAGASMPASGAAVAEKTPIALVQAAPPPQLPAGDPPYEAQLLRLSEILGALHYLRHLCQSEDGDTWREQMQALIESEQPSDERRQRMIDRFNRGYESFHSVYRICTAAATLASERYLDEGAKIAADITARYGK